MRTQPRQLQRVATLSLLVSLLVSPWARAGRGGSTGAIEAAVQSGSVDAIVAEIERAEALACLSCIAPVRALVDHPAQRVRDVAGWWLGRRGVRTEVIAIMTTRLGGQDPVAARNAADVLAGMREYSALPALKGYLAHPLDEESGQAAARAIGEIGHPAGMVALVAAFSSPLAGVRAQAARAVRQLRAPAASGYTAAPLLPLLSDADAVARLEAVLTCGYLRDRQTVAALIPLVTGDASAPVRKAAAWALGEIGDRSGAAALTQAAADSDPFVRSVATAALGRLN